MKITFAQLKQRTIKFILSVPVRWKIIGIGILPIFIFGFSLNYWITKGLSDWLSYVLSDVRIQAAMSAGSRSVTLVTFIAAAFSLVLLTLLVYILTEPIEALKKTAQEVAAGKYKTRAEVWADDEIGALAISVNRMIDNFVEIQEDLSKTNQQLEAINRISLAADREADIHDVLYIALQSFVDLLALDSGWIYLYDPELAKYHLASWINIPESCQAVLVDVSEKEPCDCQHQLILGDLNLSNEIRICGRLSNLPASSQISRHISLPIEARGMKFGIINLSVHPDRKLSVDDIELLDSISSQISEVVANAWLQIKLREKESARLLLLESLVSAQEEERKHLARELHDQAGQELTNLLIRLKTLERQSHENEITTKLMELQEMVSVSIDQIRDLSYSLRPPAIEEFGLGAAVRALASDVERQLGVLVTVEDQLPEKCSPDLEMVLYRIIQESLTNVARHAQATELKITLGQIENVIEVNVEDNGVGFDPNKMETDLGTRHLGLISMSERAELIGGRLEMFSAIGQGTRINVRVPNLKMEALHG